MHPRCRACQAPPHQVPSPPVSDGQGLDGEAPQWTDISVRPYRQPRDWRWGAGLVGRVLVATGLLLLGFVVYQLWGTGIQTHQAQNDLSDQFEELVGPTTSTIPTTTLLPTTTVATTPPAAVVDTTTTLPATTTTTTLAPAPAPAAPGDPVARIEVPTIGLDWIVVSGVGVDELKKGPGHYPDTPLPGQVGNVGIAGHRTTYGAPFYRINELVAGDDVILTTPGGRYVYKVTDQFIVEPSQSEVLAPTADADADPHLVPPALLGEEADHRPGRPRPDAVLTAHGLAGRRRPRPSRPSLPRPTLGAPRLACGRLGGRRDPADHRGATHHGHRGAGRGPVRAGLVRRSGRLAPRPVLGAGPDRGRRASGGASPSAPTATGSGSSSSACRSSSACTSSTRT